MIHTKMKKGSKTLFNDITIKGISSILAKIDEQIIELHTCSSDDFMGLYTDFKKYYNHSKVISKNANEIFRLLSEESNRNLFIELQSLYKDLNKLQNQFHSNLTQTRENIKSIKSLLEQLFIPIKNYKQNLYTLKFLIANINLSDIDHSAQEEDNWDDIIVQSNKIIDEYSEICLLSERYIFIVESKIANILLEFESYCNNNSNDFDFLLNSIHYLIIFFAEKHEEVKRQIPELTTKTENNSQSIAHIITNLQYHDIISQKIDHIQQSHKKMQNEFRSLNDISSSDAQKEAQLFQKIKGIAGIQAAILVKANKEYQLAIEVITKKFLEIGDDLLGITSICMRLNSSKDDSDEVHFSGMLEKLYNSDQIFINFKDNSNTCFKHIEQFKMQLHQATESIRRVIDSSQRCQKVTKSITSFFSQRLRQDSNINSVLSHIVGISKDIQQFEDTIQNVFIEVIKNENEQISQNILYNETFGKSELASNSGKKINSLLSQLKAKNDRINFLLDENITQSTKTIKEIKESIQRIRYYEFFENSITNIISELNDIHLQLKGKGIGESNQKNYLNGIKKLYTMESEYEIHDKIVSQRDGLLLSGDLPIDENEKPSRSDDVELF